MTIHSRTPILRFFRVVWRVLSDDNLKNNLSETLQILGFISVWSQWLSSMMDDPSLSIETISTSNSNWLNSNFLLRNGKIFKFRKNCHGHVIYLKDQKFSLWALNLNFEPPTHSVGVDIKKILKWVDGSKFQHFMSNYMGIQFFWNSKILQLLAIKFETHFALSIEVNSVLNLNWGKDFLIK